MGVNRCAVRATFCAGLAALTVAMTACGGGSSGDSATTGGTPAGGGTLLVDQSFDLELTTDPARMYSITGFLLDHALYDTLLTFKGSDVKELVPNVAESYKASPDARTFTFKLRKDVKFSDGTPLTADDVVFSFRRLQNVAGNPSYLLGDIKVTKTDDYTVVLTSKKPNLSIPYVVTVPPLGIVNAKAVKRLGGTDAPNASKTDKAEAALNRESQGSGPFVLESFSTTSQVVLKRNPNYWNKDAAPSFDEVILRNAAAPAQAQNIQRGSHQVALNLSATQAGSLPKDRVQVSEAPSTATFFVLLNQSSAISDITSNPKFMEAVRYGIDYDGMVALAGKGASQATGMLATSIRGSVPADGAVKRDLDRAKQALAESGVAKPTITLEFATDFQQNGLSTATLAQKLKADLAEVGITVNLKGAPYAVSNERYHDGKSAFGIYLTLPDVPDPITTNVDAPGEEYGMRAGWEAGADPSVTKAMEAASTSADPDERVNLYRSYLTLLNQRGPFVPLVQPSAVTAASNDVTDVSWNPLWTIDLAAAAPAAG